MEYVLAVCGTPGNNSDVVIQRYTGSENQKWIIFSTDSKFYATTKAPSTTRNKSLKHRRV